MLRMPTRAAMFGADEIQSRLLNALLKPLWASGSKGAPGRQLIETWGLALDGAQALHANPGYRT